METTSKKTFQCSACEERFTRKYNLERHVNTPACLAAANLSVRCGLCEFRGAKRRTVADHYSDEHDIDLNAKIVELHSSEAFESWKNMFEHKTKSKFVKLKGSTASKSGEEVSYYVCHRDGNFKSKGRQLRHIKVQGSNKINCHCPANIKVHRSSESLLIKYVDTHVGHTFETSSKKANKIPHQLRDLRSRHKKTLDVFGEYAVQRQQEEGVWNVQSFDFSDVCAVAENRARCACALYCQECEACVHAYSCSCDENAIKKKMCKHIHLVGLHLKGYDADEAATLQADESDSNLPEINHEIVIITTDVSNECHNREERSFHRKKQVALEKTLRLHSLIETEEQLRAYLKQIAPLERIIASLSEV